jgi:hypothetical protein
MMPFQIEYSALEDVILRTGPSVERGEDSSFNVRTVVFTANIHAVSVSFARVWVDAPRRPSHHDLPPLGGWGGGGIASNLPAVFFDIVACDYASRSQIAAATRESCRVPCLLLQAALRFLRLVSDCGEGFKFCSYSP